MKIKSVCEHTGLSDRAIRYYIEEGLISPAFTENYLGRKAFDFADSDINALDDIAVLRKFDFTIEEIRTMIHDPEASTDIIFAVKRRTEEAAESCQNKLVALSSIQTEKAYSVAELADALSKPSYELPIHYETAEANMAGRIISVFRIVLIGIIVWLPVILSLLVAVSGFISYQYPVLNPAMLAITGISLFPSVVMLIISKMKYNLRRISRCVLLLLCAISIPFSFCFSLGIFPKSETTDFRYYRDFDAGCLANRNIVFQELFPTWPHYFENEKQDDGSYRTVYLDSNYYYHYYAGIDYTYDIFAEWTLDEVSYVKEVDRASTLLQDAVGTYSYKYTEIQKGDYTCFILYDGDEPFNMATNSYTYLIFACNDIDKTVRYIYCDSLENGADQPYYLSLDWSA